MMVSSLVLGYIYLSCRRLFTSLVVLLFCLCGFFVIVFIFFCSFVVFFACFFFFSSRRRHTRCLSDWSSDVCSSDLVKLGFSSDELQIALARAALARGEADRLPERFGSIALSAPSAKAELRALVGTRSEERRVGKECRSRWAADRQTNTQRKPPWRVM